MSDLFARLATARRGAIRNAFPMLAAGWLLTACGGGAPPQPPPPDVSVAQVVSKRVREWDSFEGRITAIETVEIRPRVSGYLKTVDFREGGEVKKGDLLFTVDDREYRAALDSARANTVRAQTRADVARIESERSEKLLTARAVSQEELESRKGEFRQAEADVSAARAQQRQSALDVEFTRIVSPIDGYVSSARVRPGNLVTAETSVLTTVVSVDPVYVEFEGDERMYLKYQEMARRGERESSRDARNPVRVGLAGEEGYPHLGEMVFVDNALDPGTGTIRARALLPNKNRVFTPGLFARVELLGSGDFDALLVHERAVLTDQDRRYVYVVGADGKAVRRDVELGIQTEGLRVVRAGLKPSDRVIVNGVRKIFFPGMPVKAVLVPMDAPEGQPAQAGGAAPPAKDAPVTKDAPGAAATP